jgi:hypothetical protein
MPKIFESPDGGRTVYSREFGETDRALEFESPSAEKARLMLKNRQDWEKILNAAEDNPALQEAIERVKLLYHLGKKNGQEQIR